MNLMGWSSRKRASSRRPSLARTAVSPTSPVSIPASCTSAAGLSNASAMAASSSPSRSPMRSSPVRILTTYLAVRPVAAPEQRAEDRTLGRGSGGGLHRGIGLRHFHDPRGVARVRLFGPVRENVGHGPAQVRGAIVASPRAPAVVPASCVTAAEIAAQPRPTTRWSDSGKGRPERKTPPAEARRS